MYSRCSADATNTPDIWKFVILSHCASIWTVLTHLYFPNTSSSAALSRRSTCNTKIPNCCCLSKIHMQSNDHRNKLILGLAEWMKNQKSEKKERQVSSCWFQPAECIISTILFCKHLLRSRHLQSTKSSPRSKPVVIYRSYVCVHKMLHVFSRMNCSTFNKNSWQDSLLGLRSPHVGSYLRFDIQLHRLDLRAHNFLLTLDWQQSLDSQQLRTGWMLLERRFYGLVI